MKQYQVLQLDGGRQVQAKCKKCSWRGTRMVGGALGESVADSEGQTHVSEHRS